MELLEQRGFRAAAAAAACVVALTALWIQLRLGGARTALWVDDSVTPAAAAIAFACCLQARAQAGREQRSMWTLLSCATACWTLAEVTWGLYALILHEPVPFPSWADVGYLAAIPLTVAALLVHPQTAAGLARKARSLLDGLAVAAALLFLSWTLVLERTWHSTDVGTAGGVVTLAYPVGDVVIVFAVVVALRRMAGADRMSLWCLLAALLVMAGTDSAYTYLTETGSYSSSGPDAIDVGWIAAYLGIGLAALASQPTARRQSARTEGETPSLLALVAPLLPMSVALAAAAVELGMGERLHQSAWLIALTLVVLVLARQTLLVIELIRPRPDGEWDLRRRLRDAALERGARTGEPIAGPVAR